MSVSQKRMHLLGTASAGFYLAFLFYITLVPHYENEVVSDNFFVRLLINPILKNPTLFILDINPALAVLGNLVLFAPLFPLVYKLGGTLRLEIELLICAALPAVVEFLQFWIPGRDPSLTDFILNVTGLIGFYIFAKTHKWARS